MAQPSRVRTTVALLAPALLLLVLYVGVAWLVGRQLPTHATVAGVHLGGMTPQAARERLAAKLADEADEPVTFDLAGTIVRHTPARIGLSVDLDATFAGVTGFSLDPRRVWAGLNGGGPIPLRNQVDIAWATKALAADISSVERPVTEAAVTLTSGRVETVRPREGLSVDLPAALEQLRTHWPEQTRVVAPVRRVQPQVSTAAFDAAVTGVARPAVAEPLVVVLGRRETSVPVKDFAPALSMVAASGTLELRVEGAPLAAALRDWVAGLETDPVDATVRMVAGRPAVVPAEAGRRLDERATAARALVALTAPAGRAPTRRAAIVTTATPAPVGTDEARAWGVEHRLARVTLPDAVAGLPAPDAQRANVATAVAALTGEQGRLLRPGESVSLIQVLGDPAGRYPDAPEPTAQGARWQPGGGLSQLASALYAAAWDAGLDVGSRRPHEVHLPGYPEGLDAVYGWPDADVTLSNPGPGAVLVQASTGGGSLEVALWGRRDSVVTSQVGPRLNLVSPVPAPDPGAGGTLGCVEQPLAADGFDVEVRRRVVRGRTELPAQTEVVHYAALQPVRCTASGAWVDPGVPAPGAAPEPGAFG